MHHLVEQALGALRGVTSPDDVARATRDAADEIDRAWHRSPLVAGLAGDLAARSELINTLAGERVLDPYARALGSPPLRIKRGPVIRYRVLHDKGAVDDRPMPAFDDSEDPDLAERAAGARSELASQETVLAEAERALPVLVRERPKPWAIWLWPVRWILRFVHRHTLARKRATARTVLEIKRELAGVEALVERRAQRERAARDRYYGELRLLCAGGPAGQGIREIQLEILGGVPDDVELVELMGELRAAADADAVIAVQRDGLYAPTPAGEPVPLGEPSAVLAELPGLLRRARALTLGRRARDKLGTARAEIDVELDRLEVQFRGRIERLDKLALTMDRTRFKAVQLDRVRPMVVASVNAVMEHASVHMGSELAQLGGTWIGAVANANSSDELKAAIAKIEEEWPVAAKRIAEEVRVLVMGGAGGVARDLYAETVSVLRAHGLAEEHLRAPTRAPEVAPVQLLPSLVNPTTFTLGGNWFAGLFRSFDARKLDMREKVHARVEHIREVAAAELLDAEPKLHASIVQALAAQLDTAIELQMTWHRQALAHEHTAIAHEREAQALLVKSREAIISASAELDRLAKALETEQPGVSAAAVAAAS